VISHDLFAAVAIEDICASLTRQLVAVVRARAARGYMGGDLVARKAIANRTHTAQMVAAGASKREAAEAAQRCWDEAYRIHRSEAATC